MERKRGCEPGDSSADDDDLHLTGLSDRCNGRKEGLTTRRRCRIPAMAEGERGGARKAKERARGCGGGGHGMCAVVCVPAMDAVAKSRAVLLLCVCAALRCATYKSEAEKEPIFQVGESVCSLLETRAVSCLAIRVRNPYR